MDLTEKVVALIPARAGSTRLRGKNVYPIRGVPLIAYTLQAALATESVGRVAVSTDDPKVMEVGLSWGAQIIERPAEFCRDTSPIEEALRHALEFWRQTMEPRPQILVWLQADVPIRRLGLIDEAVEILRSDGQTSGVATGFRVSQHPAWMKTIDPNGHLRPLDPHIAQYRAQDLPDLFLLDGAIVAIRPENLEQYGEPTAIHMYLGKTPRLLLQDHPMYSLNIETLGQAELAEFYLERYPQHQILSDRSAPIMKGRDL